MILLIKADKRPRKCDECRGWFKCEGWEKEPYTCPIVGEIEDNHGRLIDADKLCQSARYWSLTRGDRYFQLRVESTILEELLKDAPIVLEASEEKK